MIIKTVASLAKSPGLFKALSVFSNLMLKFKEFQAREEIGENKQRYLEKENRVLDAITMKREPDRVPVAFGGLNFFPAKYTGISCADYMFDHEKMKKAYLKTNDDFDMDLTFPSFMLSIGGLLTAADVNLVKIPGRDLKANSCYQYNEYNRLKREEYDEFLQRGIPFLLDTIAPRISGVFSLPISKRIGQFGRILIEIMDFMSTSMDIMCELKKRGQYNLMTGFSFPPFDMMSFIFRDLTELTKDMMKKDIRTKLQELINRIEPWLTPALAALPKMMGSRGIFFPSERAFSLSPRQFEQYYWPTLKKMIINFVKEGDIPFLVWESDVTHLIHFLKELPTKISRRCCFMCDTSDIFEVNRILDGHMCIMGNVPLSTMCVGTPKDVEKYCEKMFAELMPGGGFINCSALGIPDEAKPENVHALINYTKKHGNYN